MNELTVIGGNALTSGDMRGRVNLIQEVMRSVMKDGVHYGIIPGCPKPSLFKPGAEVLSMTFGISVESEKVEDLSSLGEKRYRVTCVARSSNGNVLGSAVGECSSGEEKYKWRKPVCDEEYEDTDFDKKREKWKKSGYDKKTRKPIFSKIKQVRMEPDDLANTILQMSDKRAFVAVVRKVTAASDIFTQDIEEMEGVTVIDESGNVPTYKKPQPKKETLNEKDFKTITSKFDGVCKGCSGSISAGDKVLWNPSVKGAIYHLGCLNPPEEIAEEPVLQEVTEAMLENLQKMAKAAKVKLIDRIGVDGLDSLNAMSPEYVQNLLKEFAEKIDANAK